MKIQVNIYRLLFLSLKLCFTIMVVACFDMSVIVAKPDMPFLGIGFSEFEKGDFKGIQVNYIVPNSAADTSDLKKGDIIYMVDYQHLASSNISENFKRYINDEKSVDEQLVLHYVRNNLMISKQIDGSFIDVDYDVDNVLTEVNQLIANNSLSFKFHRNAQQKIVKLNLATKPLVQTSSPNISLSLFPSISYIAPYYSELIDVLKVYDGYEDHFSVIEKFQYYNEFWDDGLRFPLIRYLHVYYDKLPSFTRLLQQELGVISPHDVFLLQQRLADSIVKSDPVIYPRSKVFKDHYDFIQSILLNSSQLLDKALAGLSVDDRSFILAKTPVIMQQLTNSFIIVGNEFISDHDIANYFVLLKKVDLESLVLGYSQLLQLWNPDWLQVLSHATDDLEFIESSFEGISGSICFSAETKLGLFVIAGTGDNTYTKDVSFLIDLGGNDTYRNNAAGYYTDHFINVLIDLDGNDIYSSTMDHSQGSGFLGYGLLLDLKGDDLYRAVRLSQGAGVFGFGAIVDWEGDDSYVAQDFSQGIALGGQAFIYDFRGDDHYSSSLFSQAVGLTSGVGSIFDFYGDDSYLLGNRDFSSYGSSGIFKGAGQGFGFGFRHVSSGGIGLLYDYKGNDQYESGNFSQGTGYFYGLGVLVDDRGNDVYIGSRYSIASAAHSALGILRDRRGDDSYQTIYGSSMGIAWDNSNSFFIDEAGNDVYDCIDRNFCLAQADHNSFALFNDKDGKDVYMANFNKVSPSNSYNGGESFSIHIDEGGDNDIYSGVVKLNNVSKVPENSYLFLDLKSSLAKYLRQL